MPDQESSFYVGQCWLSASPDFHFTSLVTSREGESISIVTAKKTDSVWLGACLTIDLVEHMGLIGQTG